MQALVIGVSGQGQPLSDFWRPTCRNRLPAAAVLGIDSPPVLNPSRRAAAVARSSAVKSEAYPGFNTNVSIARSRRFFCHRVNRPFEGPLVPSSRFAGADAPVALDGPEEVGRPVSSFSSSRAIDRLDHVALESRAEILH